MRRKKLAVVMVGLPARGKSYIAHKLNRYLNWLGNYTRTFNVGEYRRARYGNYQAANFFSPDNPEARARRRELAMAALDDLFSWLHGDGGDVAIYDATNTTRARRELVMDRCAEEGVDCLFIETVCHDPAVIEGNIRETKTSSPDYKGQDADAVVGDFLERIRHYERAYESIVRDDCSYVKLTDMGRNVVMNRIRGEMGVRIAHFLMSLHSVPRAVWLTRHGESEFNHRSLIGGDPRLSGRGIAYAKALAKVVESHEAKVGRLALWTSTLRRAVQTAGYLDRPTTRLHALDEIHAGICEGMSYQEIESQMPEEFSARARDKLTYRYPRGESYTDLIDRIDPVVLMLERLNAPVLVIAHQAVLRVLYAYLMGTEGSSIPHLDIPLHTLIKLTPNIHGFDEERFPLRVSDS